MEELDFLRKVALFSNLPEEDLERICREVTTRELREGEILFNEGEAGNQAYVIKEGKIEIFKTTAGQRIQLAVREPGEVIGEISLLDDTSRRASGVALSRAVLLAIRRETLDRLIDTNPASARVMLKTTIMRLQSTEASLRQSEKMAQLGSFTAGIAHEVNNPSSAVLRGAEQLRLAINLSQDLAYELRIKLSEYGLADEYDRLKKDLLEQISTPPSGIDPVNRLDQENEVEEWLDRLERSGPDDLPAWTLASSMVDLGFDRGILERIVERFPAGARFLVIRWMTAEAEVQRLVEEVHEGAARISEIVKALKSYVYLGQAPNQEIDLHEGLEDTLVILRHKLKQGVEVVREYDRTIPRVAAYGSELNQVWTNLIDNSIDAMGGKGRIILRTQREGDLAVVEVEDNGPGIAPEIQGKLFYPFFTTKPVGQGTGLGLSISQQIIHKHGGTIQVKSEPGKTCFQVRLPVVGKR